MLNLFTGFYAVFDSQEITDLYGEIYSSWEDVKDAFETGEGVALFRPSFAWETGGKDVYKPILRDGEAPFDGALRLIGETSGLDGDDIPVFEEYVNGTWRPFHYLFLGDYAEGTEGNHGFCRTKWYD